MTIAAPAKLQDRAARNARKRDEKKAQIARSAMRALQELGYANTSLRDIAAKADLSLGMLHYYFEDRMQLIVYCVMVYKSVFTSRIDEALADIEGRAPVIEALANALASSIVEDGATHGLWYDIRAQAVFDPAFRPVVAEIEASMAAVVRVAGIKAGRDGAEVGPLDYALIDGVFRYQMQSQLTDKPRSHESLANVLRTALEKIF